MEILEAQICKTTDNDGDEIPNPMVSVQIRVDDFDQGLELVNEIRNLIGKMDTKTDDDDD